MEMQNIAAINSFFIVLFRKKSHSNDSKNVSTDNVQITARAMVYRNDTVETLIDTC